MGGEGRQPRRGHIGRRCYWLVREGERAERTEICLLYFHSSWLWARGESQQESLIRESLICGMGAIKTLDPQGQF